MDSETLKEIASKETETLSNLIKDGKISSVMDLYPEIKKKVTNCVYTNHYPSESILIQLPFFDKVIMPIMAIENEELYKKTYGIDVEQTLDLIKKNKIIPIIDADYNDFNNVNDNYLDDLLDLRSPSILREATLQVILKQNNGLSLQETLNDYKQAQNDVLYLLNIEDKLNDQLKLWKPKSEDVIVEENFYKQLILDNYMPLYTHGYGDLGVELLDPTDLIKTMELMHIYSKIFVETPFLSFEGVQSINPNYLDVNIEKILKDKSSDVIFPFDVGKLLIEKFRLIYNENIFLDISDQTKKARTALWELDGAVKKGEIEKVKDRSIILQETWRDTKEMIESMESQRKKTKLFLQIAFGIGGTMSTHYDLGLLAGVGFLVASHFIPERAANLLIRYTKPSHVLALFDLQKSKK